MADPLIASDDSTRAGPAVLRDIASTSWEHPADRAALQALRAIPALDDALRLLMKCAGGTFTGRHPLNLEAYEAQVAEYEQHDGIDGTFAVLTLLHQSHPFNTARAAELLRWGSGPEYAAIRRGEYRRRSEQSARVNPVAELGSAAEHYAGQAKSFAHELSSTTQKVADQASSYARRVMVNALTAARNGADSLSSRLVPKDSEEDPPES